MKTVLLVTACYDEAHRTMGSAPKLARQLAKKCRVVVFAGGSSDRVEDRESGERVYFVKEWLLPDPINNAVVPGMFRKLDEVLAKERPDAVLNLKYLFYPNLAAPYLKRKGYRVVTVTDAFPGRSWWSASWIVNLVLWFSTRTFGEWILRKSDRVVLFHQGLVADAERLGLDYEVIPNGVELEDVRKARKKRLKGRVVVTYVGRLESVKGYETIFNAMRRVIGKRLDIHFYHVGDIAGKDGFVREYESDNIHFLGRLPISDVYRVLKASDIVVLASRSEGLPNALLEGMACGCVPVSTPVGAVPYLLEDGRLGRLFPYGDDRAMAREILDLASDYDRLDRLKRECRKKIASEYDWDDLRERYYSVLF